VFAAGQFRPLSEEGRRLLAHELAHVVQQSGYDVVRRQCTVTPVPPVSVPVGAALPFRYTAAERCLQRHYAATHKAKTGISLSFNLDWLHISGGTANEKLALQCLRGGSIPGAGPAFTGKSGMFAGEPDIWDFMNQTMYEITTFKGAPERFRKLGLEIAQANAITTNLDCGGLSFDRGTWAPSGPLKIGTDLWITVINASGVLIYTLWKDAAKELSVVLTATLAAILKKGGAGGVARAAGRRAIPVYAAASLAAIAIMLASGKAEAKIGPGEEEPLIQLFRTLRSQGITVPPSVQHLIESDPALKQKINDAMSGKGSPSDAQQALMQATMKLIEQNPDQFSAEDLETLLTIQETATGAGVAGGPQSAEELRKMLDAVRRGQKASSVTSGRGQGGAGARRTDMPGAGQPPQPGSPGGATEVAKAVAAVSGPRRRVLDALLGPGKTGVSAAPVINDLIAALPADLSDTEATQLIRSVSTTPPTSAEEALASVQAGVAALRGSKSAQPGGLGPDQIAALVAAAKTVRADLPRGTFRSAVPDEPKTGHVYGVQLRGRTDTGVPYAALASVRLDTVNPNEISGTILTHSDGIGVNGDLIFFAGELVGTKLSWRGGGGGGGGGGSRSHKSRRR
jgi:hypothetical protein